MSPQAYPKRQSTATAQDVRQARVPAPSSTQAAPGPHTSAGMPTVPQSMTEQ
jgi:hypothetical protein